MYYPPDANCSFLKEKILFQETGNQPSFYLYNPIPKWKKLIAPISFKIFDDQPFTDDTN